MRQNSIQNRLQMISMEEYLEKRQKIRETERKRDAKAFVFLCGGNMDPFSCGGVFYCTCHEAWKKEELPVSDRAWCAGPGRADHRFIKEKTGCCFIVSSGLSFGEDHRIRRSGKR